MDITKTNNSNSGLAGLNVGRDQDACLQRQLGCSSLFQWEYGEANWWVCLGANLLMHYGNI